MARAPRKTAELFATNVLAARAALQIERSTLAARMQAAGYPKWNGSTIRLIELGQRYPRLDEAAALAHGLRLPLDRLITETPTRVKALAREVLMREPRGADL